MSPDIKVNIVTFFDDQFGSLGELTASVARDYAERNGYRFRCYRKALLSCERHVYWNKVAILLKELEQTEFTLWLDADVLVVGRQRIEDLVPGAEMIVSRDKDGLCCGVILVKNTEWARSFLQAWLLLGDVDPSRFQSYEARNLRDQTALKCLVSNFPSVRNRVSTWSEDVVLNPGADYFNSPLFMHYWASSGRLGEIMDRVKLFSQNGWGRECFLDFHSIRDDAAWADAERQKEV